MASSLRLGAGAAALERGPLYYYHGLLDQRQYSQGAAAPVHDLEWGREDHRARGRQLVEVAEARESELARPVHDRVVRKGWVESARLARVGADRLYADAQHIPVVRQ